MPKIMPIQRRIAVREAVICECLLVARCGFVGGAGVVISELNEIMYRYLGKVSKVSTAR